MIFYFSATGNSKYVTERISKCVDYNESMIAITDCMKQEKFSFIVEEEALVGIVSPVYGWGLPSIVREFLEKLELSYSVKPYTYFVATYGTSTGQIGAYANEIIKKKSLFFDAYYSIKMPDTWTPVFDLSDISKVAAINERSELQLIEVIQNIDQRKHGDFIKHKIPRFAANIESAYYENKMRCTKHFHVENSCIGCGLCQNKCPASAIELHNGLPVWVKDKCIMCLGCLHRCPKFSIQYGKSTKKHGQYINPNVKI